MSNKTSEKAKFSFSLNGFVTVHIEINCLLFSRKVALTKSMRCLDKIKKFVCNFFLILISQKNIKLIFLFS